MEGGTVSQTAMGGAFSRAIHQLYDAPPKLYSDPIVVRLVESAEPGRLAASREAYSEPDRVRMRALGVRQRFTEEELALAVAGGVRQYVILGAGLDTFAYRQPTFAGDLGIFEVDHPATQARKRELLHAASVAVPPNLSWAPVDFEQQTLADGLSAAGFDATLPSFFSWLGVTQYRSS